MAVLLLTKCTLLRNVAYVRGAIVIQHAARLVVTDSTFLNNSAGGVVNEDGGEGACVFIYSAREATFDRTLLQGNVAARSLQQLPTGPQRLSSGGVLCAQSLNRLTLDSCVITYNEADMGAAFAVTFPKGSTRIFFLTSCFIACNRATTSDGGVFLMSDWPYIPLRPASITTNNSALLGAGGVMFVQSASLPGLYRLPELESIFGTAGNVALYGPDFANPPMFLRLVDTNATRTLQNSSQIIAPPLVLCLYDALEQRASSVSSAVALVDPPEWFQAQTRLGARDGCFIFDSLRILVQPGSNISATITVPSLPAQEARQVMIRTRRCGPGELINDGACRPCPPGSYSAAQQSESCALCEPGRAHQAWGQAACPMCSTGHFTRQNGSTICLQCDVNEYAADEGSSTCAQCDVGVQCANGGWLTINGYWANVSPVSNGNASRLAVGHCPPGYCWHGNTCAVGRDFVDNPLCGRCQEGWSEVWWSPYCVGEAYLIPA